MRRKDKEIADRAEMESIIRESTICRLALADNEQPYIVPLSFGYKDNALYFHSAAEGKKIDILRKNKNVCFEFDVGSEIKTGKTACEWGMKYRSVIGFGNASFLEDPDSKQAALDIIMHQYSDETFAYSEKILKKTLVIKVEITHMTGKQSS
ncbi:MAG: pyridoxamine 5'-phosphate oxidase family protein [Deltaproteobacteria bacterium]|nr:pyridoxamine 5'-phosphate oxidase family protein [Deltaproteobacteria bacterium]